MARRTLARWLLLATVLMPAGSALARELVFEDRVRAQDAIERVVHSHQIGTRRTFAEAVPQELLERKVRRYLKQTVAVQEFWHTPVTAEALDREIARMAQGSRMPERLRELYAALGDDPFLVRECLARPVLVDRLARNFFAFDDRIHAASRDEIDGLAEDLRNGRIDPRSEHPRRIVAELVRTERTVGAHLTHGEGGQRIELQPEEFDRLRARLPQPRGMPSSISEERDAFRVELILDEKPSELVVASFVVPKRSYDAWWAEAEQSFDAEAVAAADGGALGAPRVADVVPFAAASTMTDDVWDNGKMDFLPYGRVNHTAVWTGSEMIVWGGEVYGFPTTSYNTGGRYNPATDTWSPTSLLGAPAGRLWHSAVWTGSQMIVWGGNGNKNTGGRYDPVADTWLPTSTVNVPAGRAFHTAVWTGSRMVVWGGTDGSPLNTGGRYDPQTDSWTWTSVFHAPSPRANHTAVWTGNRMVVWGGTGSLNTGGRYDPVADTWASTSTVNAPSGRSGHTAVWTGTVMVVWGGGSELDTGGRYDPVLDTWAPTSTVGAPAGRFMHTAVWTGSRMAVWGGGKDPTFDLDTGGLYDPTLDTWTATSTLNAPAGRRRHKAVWAGDRMIVWGGEALPVRFNSGGRYDPLTDSWTPTATGAPPGQALGHAVWTGSHMIVWGGKIGNPDGPPFTVCLDTGGRYDPATDSWTATSTVDAPGGRQQFTSVWTGDEMIVWGGTCGGAYMDGSRYDPLADTWTPTTMTGGPTSRYAHSAVWTGSEMIVWGGANPLPSGGRYDPRTDSWTPTSLDGAPSRRFWHSAVWTGSEMIVWGGQEEFDPPMPDGGRYDPVTDTWTPVSTAGAPAARSAHAAVWTGQTMVIWGGTSDEDPVQGGGRYNPDMDTWAPVSTTGAPEGRPVSSAVWTGALMVVWGGGWAPNVGPMIRGTGGRYEPVGDTWTPITMIDAPSPRWGQAAVWTGEQMIVWGGGQAIGDSLNTGGRYRVDADQDGVADGLDCAPIDGDSSGPAAEVAGLKLGADKGMLGWNAAGPGSTYDVVRGLIAELPVGGGAGESCLASGITQAEANDSDVPQTGAGFFYLVRARNACGPGTWGTDSAGGEQSSGACPQP